MPKALLPMVASLLLCGTATAALIVTNANAGTQTKPVMVALAGAPNLGDVTAAPPPDAGAPMADRPDMKDMAERRAALCGEIGARAAGRLAYLEARLDLTAAQKPLFERWKDVRLTAAQRIAQKCDSAPKKDMAMRGEPRSPVERLAREEEMLKNRLAEIGAERPALAALYGSLTDEQKAKFAPGRMAMMGRGPMHGRMGGMRHRMPPPGGPEGGPDGAPPQ